MSEPWDVEDEGLSPEEEAIFADEFYGEFLPLLAQRGKVRVITDSIAGRAVIVLSGSEEEYRREEAAVAEILSGIYMAEGRLMLSAWVHERLNRQ